jgi:hypothetical protein
MTKSREQGNEGTRAQENERVKQLLRSAMPRIGDEPALDRDLWPAMLRRMDAEAVHRVSSVPWFDWALAGGLVAFAAIVPRTIPVILYYL